MNRLRTVAITVGCYTWRRRFERKMFLSSVCVGLSFLNNKNNLHVVKRFYYSNATRISEKRLLHNLNLVKTESNKISVKDLSYLPHDCIKHRKEKQFIIYLNLWWNMIEKNLTAMSGDQLAPMFFNLSKINCTYRGNIVKILTWDPIKKMADCVLAKIGTDVNFTPL